MADETRQERAADVESKDMSVDSDPSDNLEERRPVSIEDADVVTMEAAPDDGDSDPAADAVTNPERESTDESDTDPVLETRVARAGEAGPDAPTVHPHRGAADA